jgi:hypothetical protein
MKKIIIFFSLLIASTIIPNISTAYDAPTTHAGITEQVIEFYNLNNNIKISSVDKELIIQGSIDEDIEGRPLNHFYEPQREMGINNYRNAINWVTETNNTNEFTWGKSIEKYAKGDRSGALIGLGHILHVAEDMTVPDHTRNDPHIGEGFTGGYTNASPYEDWAKENETRSSMAGTADYYKIKGFIPRRGARSIEDYLANIAAYSNNNYVSRDTIVSSVYPFPYISKKRNGYAYGEDTYFYDEHKLFIDFINRRGEEIIALIYKDFDNIDNSVPEDYFNRLVKMAILSGTGITEMFFREAERARAKYLEAERVKQEKIADYETEKNSELNNGGLLSKIWYWTSYAVIDTASSIAGAVSNTFSTIGSSIYNGTSLAINVVSNSTNGIVYTNNELTTIAGKKIEGAVLSATRAIVSTSKKVVLYVKENTLNPVTIISPAAVFTPPVSNNSANVTQAQLAQILAIISSPTPTLLGTSNDDDNDISSDKPSRGNRHSSHSTVVTEAVPISNIATTTEEIIDIATTTEEVATTTEEVATTTEETATTTATTTEEIATTTATTTEIIDTEAPEFTLVISEPCLNSSDLDYCLIATTALDFVFISSSTDIDFYTISIDDGEEDDFVTATTSVGYFSAELENYYTYQISFTATDISGNTSTPIITNLDINTHPIIIDDVYWIDVNSVNYASNITLFNNTSYEIDLSSWSLETDDDLFHLDLVGKIEATNDDAIGTFFLKKGEENLEYDYVNQFFLETFSDEDGFLNLRCPSGIIYRFKLKFEQIYSC